MKPKITAENYVEFVRRVHGDSYDYSQVNFENLSKKVVIICKEHGQFEQSLSCHIGRAQGCPSCAKRKVGDIQKSILLKNAKNILEKFEEKHGQKYDYSSVNYKGSHVPVDIICRKHGVFLQKPCNHLRGQGCPKCAAEFRRDNLKISHESFIERARAIHGDKYEYFFCSSYKAGKTSVRVKCPLHGTFDQCRNSHLLGKGCSECSHDSISKKLLSPFSEFVERANAVYQGKYSYNEASWRGYKRQIVVTCPEHGDFEVNAYSHLLGSRCGSCRLNGFESSVLAFLKQFGENDIKMFDRDTLDGLELDFKIGNVAIECNGSYWHSFNRKESPDERRRHSMKVDECQKRGIKLIQINEFEWVNKRPVVESILRNVFGGSERVSARKCEIVVLTMREAQDFLGYNHIQGYRSALVHYGLVYDKQVVAVLSISGHPKYEYEMIRYCNSLNHTVIGGLSKLFNRFRKDFKPEMMISFADRRFFDGLSYKNLGFILDGITEPNYCYIKRYNILSRQKCQKHKLQKFLPLFDKNLTESENMFLNGYRRLWDAGNYRYIFKA